MDKIRQFGPKMDQKWTKISKTGPNGPKMDQNDLKNIVDQPVHPG